METATKTLNTRTPSRRNLIRGAAAAFASGAAFASPALALPPAPILPVQDAAIFRLQTEFRKTLHDVRQVQCHLRPLPNEAVLWDRLKLIVSQVTATRPTTGEGFRAKAAIIAENDVEFYLDGNEKSGEDLAMESSLLTDLMAAVGA